MHLKPAWLAEVSTQLGVARGRAIAAAKIGRAKMPAAFRHLADKGLSWRPNRIKAEWQALGGRSRSKNKSIESRP
jgi:hypothetical protein